MELRSLVISGGGLAALALSPFMVAFGLAGRPDVVRGLVLGLVVGLLNSFLLARKLDRVADGRDPWQTLSATMPRNMMMRFALVLVVGVAAARAPGINAVAMAGGIALYLVLGLCFSARAVLAQWNKEDAMLVSPPAAAGLVLAANAANVVDTRQAAGRAARGLGARRAALDEALAAIERGDPDADPIAVVDCALISTPLAVSSASSSEPFQNAGTGVATRVVGLAVALGPEPLHVHRQGNPRACRGPGPVCTIADPPSPDIPPLGRL